MAELLNHLRADRNTKDTATLESGDRLPFHKTEHISACESLTEGRGEVVAHTCDVNIQESEAGLLTQVSSQLDSTW